MLRNLPITRMGSQPLTFNLNCLLLKDLPNVLPCRLASLLEKQRPQGDLSCCERCELCCNALRWSDNSSHSHCAIRTWLCMRFFPTNDSLLRPGHHLQSLHHWCNKQHGDFEEFFKKDVGDEGRGLICSCVRRQLEYPPLHFGSELQCLMRRLTIKISCFLWNASNN